MKPKPSYLYLVLSVLLLVNFSSCQTQPDENSNKDDSESNISKIDESIDENTANTLRPNSDNEDERTALLEEDYSQNKITKLYSDDELDSFSSADSADFFKRFAPKTQTFKIINNGEQDIFCDLGTYIHIDSGSFHFKDGSPITEPIVFEVKEFYDKSTVLLSGLTTNTDGGFLESGGMLHLKATSGGKEVHLKKKIDIEMPTTNTKKRNKNGMNVYLTSSNSATANSVSNPPSKWSDTGMNIKVRGIPMERKFRKKVFLFKKEGLDTMLSKTTDCECTDVHIVSETVEALSENLDVMTTKEYNPTFRELSFTKYKKNKTIGKKDSRYRYLHRINKDTSYIELGYNQVKEILTDPTREVQFVYDTLQIALELGKKGTAVLVEELHKTENGIRDVSFIRSINSGGGLRFTTKLNNIRSCTQDKQNYYMQSIGVWKELLEQGESEFRTWKKTQRTGEDTYNVEYKKRKNPILIWTAIVRTTQKPFTEEFRVTNKRSYFAYQTDKKKQEAYNAYREGIIARYNKAINKNAGKFSASSLESYVMGVSSLGWINCDRFYKVDEKDKVDLLVNSSSPVRVIFNKINSVMKGRSEGQTNTFASIPKNEAITVFGIRKKEDKIFMALKNTTVSTEPIDLEYREVTFDEMQKALASLN